jgi:Uma2 family endonuclease
MSVVARPRMTSDEFIAWARQRAERGRWELVDGETVAMSPERSGHALVKARVWWALEG